MKVLFLSAANSIHTVKWVNSLVARGIEILLVYNRGHEPQMDVLDKRVKRHCLKYSGSLGYYMNAHELRRVFKEFKPDLVNAHYASGYGTLARKAGVAPVLLSVWGSDVYDFPYEGKIKNSILKKNVRYASALASTSNCMANQLRKVMNDESLRIDITPFGVDMQKFSVENYTQKKKSQEVVICNIKMLKPKYGIKEIITAVNMLVKDQKFMRRCDRRIKLKIFGEGEQKEELEELVKKKKLDGVVEFCGKVPNSQVPEELSKADIFCAFSQLDSESFGVAVVEAMAMKVPVVVSDVDGFKEVVKDQETGYIINKNDINGCKQALEKLILDDDLRIKMGENGRKRVQELYDWEQNVDIMEKLYFDILVDKGFKKN
ncbi:glycosyltransferase family 4 protein [Mediterraneibacter glycyrrhizinilyticus]|nr:glycosyltransferase family 4 protein [Mediterraneibacter glycyrrhizinilyticus]MDM8125957.1 glycosyltransferase family 4 protein [Mediterraneibacter glycyrrhizinilyticus]